jgi:integrase
VKNETPESKKRKPTLDDLKTLENVAHLSRDKAIVWFIASTSFRVGTVALLNRQDLKPTGNPEVPFSFEIESKRLKGAGIGKYKGLKQIAFLHKYAYEKLVAYKQEAKLKGYDLKPESPLFIRYWNKGEVKGLTSKALGLFFDGLSLNAWGDLEQKRFSPHDLREFFQSALENASINPNTISPMMGHKVKGVDQHYSSHDIEDLLGKYETALSWLVPQTVEQIKADTKQKLAQDQKKLVGLEYENTELKGKMNNLNNRQETTEGQLALLKKYVFTVVCRVVLLWRLWVC